jgi:hypothetical protein
VLPTFKAQEDWEGGANDWRGAGGPVHIRTPGDPHPTALPSSKPPGKWAFLSSTI